MVAGSLTTLKVLFLTQVLPFPLNTGAKIRAYHLLQYLAQRHQVTLVSFVRDDEEEGAVAHLERICHAVHCVPLRRSRKADVAAVLKSIGSKEPVVIIRDRLPAMVSCLRRLMEQNRFDLVHADQTSMAQFALLAAEEAGDGDGPRLLLDQHNAMHLLVARQATHERWFGRLLWKREAQRFAAYERNLCRRFDHILTVTEEDFEALLGLFPADARLRLAKKFLVMPICVDPTQTQPVAPQEKGAHILHLGTMFWPPNIEGVLWFSREVLPLILARVPEATFTIAGKRPPQSVQALAGPHVEVTGYVADPMPLLARSQAFIVPLLAGGGMRVKIVDGWQWGMPIVSTTIGAEGIRCRPGENILLADEPAAFADAVVRLLTDPESRQRLRSAGRRWVEEEYDWRKVYASVDALYVQ